MPASGSRQSRPHPRPASRMAARLAGWVLALAACAPAAAAPLVLALSKTPLSLPFYVAERHGLFAAEGLELEVREVIGGHRALQQVVAGQADLATCSEAVVMFTSFQSRDFALLASFVTSTDDVQLVAGPGSGIEAPGQLAGRRVGTIVGAAAHYYLDTLALVAGVDPKSIQVTGLQPEAMPAALREGQVDALAVWQPFAYRAEREVPGARVLDDGGLYTLSFNLVAARRLLGTREADLEALLRALQRAEGLIAARPEEAHEVLQTRLDLDGAYVDWMWPRYRYRLTLDQALITTLESEARWARQGGLVGAAAAPDYLDLVHSAPLRRVSPAAVGLVE